MGTYQSHAGVFDSHLFPKEYNLLLRSLVFGLDPDPSVCAVGRPTPSVGRGVLSERDHVEHSRTDVLGPGLRKCGIVGGFLAAMMCSKVFLSEDLEYTLTTNWAAG